MFQTVLGTISDYAVPFLLVLIPLMGLIRRINVYAAFVDGAKEGFTTAVLIIPYLVAMLVAIGISVLPARCRFSAQSSVPSPA